MFPYDKNDKKDRIRKPSLFGDFDAYFSDLEGYASQMLQQAERAGSQTFVWGYSSYTGPDGNTVVRQFGNAPGIRTEIPSLGTAGDGRESNCQIPSGSAEAIEPFYDVREEGGTVKVTADLPGVEEKDIKLDASGDVVSLAADGGGRKYAADIRLPLEVQCKPQKTHLRNGVFEATFRKA